jgi:hypothetical protein
MILPKIQTSRFRPFGIDQMDQLENGGILRATESRLETFPSGDKVSTRNRGTSRDISTGPKFYATWKKFKKIHGTVWGKGPSSRIPVLHISLLVSMENEGGVADGEWC